MNARKHFVNNPNENIGCKFLSAKIRMGGGASRSFIANYKSRKSFQITQPYRILFRCGFFVLNHDFYKINKMNTIQSQN